MKCYEKFLLGWLGGEKHGWRLEFWGAQKFDIISYLFW